MGSKKVVGLTTYYNPTIESLKAWALDRKTTEFGSLSFVSRVEEYITENTFIVCNDTTCADFRQTLAVKEAESIIRKVNSYLVSQELICLDRQIGYSSPATFTARLYTTKNFSKLPLMWYHSTFPISQQDSYVDLLTVQVPEWPEQMVVSDVNKGITYILGTDFFGECKKAFLRMLLFKAKAMNMMALFAGSKQYLVNPDGAGLRTINCLFLGASGSEKTSVIFHDHNFESPQAAKVIQDEIVLLDKKGACYGTEDGFYVPTSKISQEQPYLFGRLVDNRAILENVFVDKEGKVDFSLQGYSDNGTAILPRSHSQENTLNLNKLDKIFLLTKELDFLPRISKLTKEQFIAFYLWVQNQENLINKRQFLLTTLAQEGNMFLEMVNEVENIEFYLINCDRDVELIADEVKAIVTKEIKWQLHDEISFQVNYFDNSYQNSSLIAWLKELRVWLGGLDGLNERIKI